jgi:Flp pilus assembly pilin Flp
MKRRFLSRTTGLGRDERGASLIELALVMPVLVLMLVALGDTARGFAEIYSVQEAVTAPSSVPSSAHRATITTFFRRRRWLPPPTPESTSPPQPLRSGWSATGTRP